MTIAIFNYTLSTFFWGYSSKIFGGPYSHLFQNVLWLGCNVGVASLYCVKLPSDLVGRVARCPE